MFAFLRRRYGTDRKYYNMFYSMFGFTPDNIELYKLALVHSSASVHLPDGSTVNNERLEFLGDAVLECVVSDFLFIEYAGHDEGFLTRLRSRLVSRSTMNDLAVKIGLDRHVIFNPNGSFIQKHLYGNAFEAVIGAMYLDKGYNFVSRLLINDIFRKFVDMGDMSHKETDYKSRLIEWCQKSRRTIRFHTTICDHTEMNAPKFTAQVYIDSVIVGTGEGLSKKEAEQEASFMAMKMMSDEMGDYILDRVDNLSRHE